MALGDVPFGVDDVKVSARDGAGDLAANKTDILGATSIALSTESDIQEARGDNSLIRVNRSNKTASGSVGMLSHDPDLMAVVGDGATAVTGVTPNTVTTYEEPAAAKSKHYMIEAQAYDGGAAARLTVFDAVTSGGPNFDWSTDSYSEPGFDYQAQAFDNDGSENVFYMLEIYETAEAIGTTNA